MTTLIVSDVNFNDPSNLIPYLEKDEAITRGVTKGLIDFSNASSYAGSGAIAAGTPINSLTVDNTAGSITTAFDPIINGMLPFSKGVPNAAVALPSTFKFTASVTKILYVLWAKIPASGWTVPASNLIWSLMGVLGNTGSAAQYGFSVQIDNTGALIKLSANVPSSGAASSGNINVLTGSALAALSDGNLHQLAILWDAKTTPGQQTTTLFVDGVSSVTNGPITYDGTFNIPTSTPNLGVVSTAFQNATPPHTGLKIGRPGLWDLSNSTLTAAAILASDSLSASGYLS